jgi:hypothetical protein
MVAVYNPGTHHVNHTTIAVPHPNFTVTVFNMTSKKFENTNATVICDNESNGVESCFLYASYVIQGH